MVASCWKMPPSSAIVLSMLSIADDLWSMYLSCSITIISCCCCWVIMGMPSDNVDSCCSGSLVSSSRATLLADGDMGVVSSPRRRDFIRGELAAVSKHMSLHLCQALLWCAVHLPSAGSAPCSAAENKNWSLLSFDIFMFYAKPMNTQLRLPPAHSKLTSVLISKTSLKLMDVSASLLCRATTTLDVCSVACFDACFWCFV